MKILMISGSKNPEGRTMQCLNAIAEGAEKAGAETEQYLLTKLKLEHCRQCNTDGWGVCRDEGYCIIKDDFQMLVDKIGEADVLVFATPVYFQDLSEIMKVFLDRLRRISCFYKGAVTHGVPAIGLALAGGGGGFAVTTCQKLESTLQMCRFDIVDMIPVRRQNFEVKLPMLRLTGEWLATKPVSNPA